MPENVESAVNYSRIELYANFLYEGMVLKGALFTEEGERIWEAFSPLPKELINQLSTRNIKKIYYEKPIIASAAPNGLLPLRVLEKAYTVSEEIVLSIKKRNPLPQKDIEETVEEFIERISGAGVGAMLNLIELKEYDEYTYTHSVNVAMLSILFGRQLGWKDEILKNLGIGAMLHDMGKIFVPIEIINKNGKLTEKEYEIVKKHTLYGYEIIKSQSTYGETIRRIPLLHHENYDGTGYPLGLKGEKMDIMTQVVAIADFFDAVVSKRSYKVEYSIWDAIILVRQQSGLKFIPRLAGDFSSRLATYLVQNESLGPGTLVKLNTGEIAEVLECLTRDCFRPIVKILISADNRPVRFPIRVMLHKDEKRWIERPVEDKRLEEEITEMRSDKKRK